jgi:SAM-dependent methyltransferase
MLKDLRNNWRSGIKDDASSLSTWNNMAERFRNFPVPKWDKDKFLKLLDSRVSFHKEMNVLDIGCGTGIFSIALSKRVAKVIAIDISDKMLEYARLNAEKHQRGNIEFICADWKDTNLQQAGWDQSFDLVIAHNTPAICDADTFEKMMHSSRDYCFFARPTRRTDSVLGELLEIIGAPAKSKGRDDDIIVALAILWGQGLLPEMTQLKDSWRMEKPLEEACEFYIDKLKVSHELDAAQEQAIKNYLRSIAVNNAVAENTRTAITIIGWRNNRKYLK